MLPYIVKNACLDIMKDIQTKFWNQTLCKGRVPKTSVQNSVKACAIDNINWRFIISVLVLRKLYIQKYRAKVNNQVCSSCTTTYYHAVPCTTMYYHVLPCSTMYYHVLPRITMQYHVLPCTTMINADYAITYTVM